jgi:hypothetical protein
MKYRVPYESKNAWAAKKWKRQIRRMLCVLTVSQEE